MGRIDDDAFWAKVARQAGAAWASKTRRLIRDGVQFGDATTQELGQPRERAGDCYLLKSRVVVGNCALFWREGSCGYTTALEDAGLYQAEDATPCSVAVPRELAEELARRHVDRDALLTRLAKMQDGG